VLTHDTFVDAAAGVCAAALEVGARTGVMLRDERGPTALAVDNAPEITDDMRLWSVTDECWRLDPVQRELRRRVAVLGPQAFDVAAFVSLAQERGFTGELRPAVAVPLVTPSAWFGTVVFGTQQPLTIEHEQRLVLLATQLCVWCTNRGISTLPDVRPLAQRQLQVAALAAAGRTNPEIAHELGISINTVKLRLKQTFERLRVDNRTALGAMLRRLAPLDGVPPGITRRDGYTITRRP
jgi:DNA-binding CsgD family transcriptional regulator